MTNETDRCLSVIAAQIERIADVLEKYTNPPWPPEGVVLHDKAHMPVPDMGAAVKESSEGIADAKRSAAQAVKEYDRAKIEYFEAKLDAIERALMDMEYKMRFF